ncbi:MAG: GNAT family N-acetyltransferase [Longimicrobiales bacterium]
MTGGARRVELIRLDPELDGALLGDPEYRAALGEGRWAEAAARVRAVVGRTVPASSTVVREATWAWYFTGDAETRELVGSCAYKAAPKEGVVEIAYFTYPPFEGRGYATAMARRLIELAMRSPEVRRVIAHTLPEASASTRVLGNAGMVWMGEVTDPDDGPVWRWQINLGEQ